MGKADFIGGRGEWVAYLHLTRLCRTDEDAPYFAPHFLGEKGRLFDFLVELVDSSQDATLFFFVQVKSTRKKYTKSGSQPRLRVEISQEDVRRMVATPAPTFVIGVHEREERAFVVAVHGAMSRAISSITTAHELTPETLRRLWREVRDFWRERDMARVATSFMN